MIVHFELFETVLFNLNIRFHWHLKSQLHQYTAERIPIKKREKIFISSVICLLNFVNATRRGRWSFLISVNWWYIKCILCILVNKQVPMPFESMTTPFTLKILLFYSALLNLVVLGQLLDFVLLALNVQEEVFGPFCWLGILQTT